MIVSRKYMVPLACLALFLAAHTGTAQHNCGQCPAAQSCPSGSAKADTNKPAEPAFQKLPGAGKKVWIGDSHYFTYRFDKTPKIGVVVLKIQLFTRKGIKDRRCEITCLSGMSSKEGSIQTEGQFKLNRLGDYLLPVNFSSHGEWEVKLVFKKDGQEIYYGSFTLKV